MIKIICGDINRKARTSVSIESTETALQEWQKKYEKYLNGIEIDENEIFDSNKSKISI